MDNNTIKHSRNIVVEVDTSDHQHQRALRAGAGGRLLKSAGFTLIEMLVVLAIISVIIGVVVVNQHSFDNSMILSNTAYDIALSVREAQAYGNAGHGNGSSSTFPVSYGTGIDFNTGTPHSYILFADKYTDPTLVSCYSTTNGPSASPAQRTGDCIYTSNEDTAIQTYTINNGFKISELYIPSVTSPVTRLDVVYAREEVTGHIHYYSDNSWHALSSNNPKSKVEVTSPDGTSHECITITTTNIISVKHGACTQS